MNTGKRYKISDSDWNLLAKLTDAAKMDWFYQEFYHRKTVSREGLEDCTAAFLKENFHPFNLPELLSLYELFARYELVDDYMRSELAEYLSNPGDWRGEFMKSEN